MVVICSVCSTNESKYTCTKCRIVKYCSLNCFTKHKDQFHNENSGDNNNNQNISVNNNSNNSNNVNIIIKTKSNNVNINNNNNDNCSINNSVNNNSLNNNKSPDEDSSENDSLSENETDNSTSDISGESDYSSDDSEMDIEESQSKKENNQVKVSKFTESLDYFKKVTQEQFDKLDNSKYITSVITHKQLKSLILEIDQQSNDFDRIRLLQDYRKKIPEFNEFILKVLATIDCLDTLRIDDNGNLIKK